MAANESKYRLGLDMGTNSIGWASVLLDDNDKPCGLLDMGVRIFPDGRNPQSQASNAVDRRLARGQRRRRDYYLKRRGKLIDSLTQFGLMPPGKSDRKVLEALNPYHLRARALDEALQPYELGRALFHLGQRRGFKSNRKAQGGDESDASQIREAIGELRQSIKTSGARTLGEFLNRRHGRGETLRVRHGLNLYPERAMYEGEFDEIRKAQQPQHTLSDEQWDTLRETVFFQRPLETVAPGACLLEDGEERAARALPLFQDFRMLQEVNNLRVRVGTEPERQLGTGERERVLKRLGSGKDIDLQKPTRDLGIPSGASFNLARGGRKAIKGDETAARLMKSKTKPERTLFGNRWLKIPLEERNKIVKFLLETEAPEEVRRKAADEWGMDEAQAETLPNVSLVNGYGNLSEKAIRRLIPHLEKGHVYSDAVTYAGYPSPAGFRNEEAHDKLPYYGVALPRDAVGADPKKDPQRDGEPAHYGRIANPTVHIGLNQLRRVVNGLIETYGKPKEIVVELARDLKMDREQKQNLLRQQQKGREANDRFKEMLEPIGVKATENILRKLRLWEEQGLPPARICPYTRKQISFEMVVSNETEIDHILPFSRTLDNSNSNMVVCVVSANREKGNRSPHEAFGHSPAEYDYEAILSNAAKMPGNKRWRFDKDAMERFEEEDRFLDRQLNETSYLSRTARAYLAHLYDEKTEDSMHRVRAVPGRMTALLRRGWKLEGMLPVSKEGEITGKQRGKQRDDHRHHAVDAFVVACTTHGLLQKFAQAAAARFNMAKDRLTAVAGEARPWDGFDGSELKPFLDKLVVSHKQDHGAPGVGGKTTGQLHNETAYGLIELREDGASRVVVRKKLSNVKRRNDLDSVRDTALRAALLELWDRVGRKDFAEQATSKGVLVGSALQRVWRVRITDEQRVIPIRDNAGKPYKGYIPGGNEFADVWRMKGGSWQMVVVSKFHANQPNFDIEDFRPRTSKGKHKGKLDPTAKRLMRIHIDDMGALGEGQDRRIMRVRKITNARKGVYVVLDDHNEANVAARANKKDDPMKENQYSAGQLQKLGFRVIMVDPIGHVNDAGTFQP